MSRQFCCRICCSCGAYTRADVDNIMWLSRSQTRDFVSQFPPVSADGSRHQASGIMMWAASASKGIAYHLLNLNFAHQGSCLLQHLIVVPIHTTDECIWPLMTILPAAKGTQGSCKPHLSFQLLPAVFCNISTVCSIVIESSDCCRRKGQR